MMATSEDLHRAAADVVSIVSEHRGGESIRDTLARLGIPAGPLSELLAERWETYKGDFNPEEPEVLFAQAATEFLLIGVKLRGGHRD